MARVLVVSDDGTATVEILRDPEGDDWVTATCLDHGELGGDHSYFEDMVQVAEVHVDQVH